MLAFCAARIARQATEGAVLCNARLTLGDDRVAAWVFDQEYDPGFVSRHTHQLTGLWCTSTGLERI